MTRKDYETIARGLRQHGAGPAVVALLAVILKDTNASFSEEKFATAALPTIASRKLAIHYFNKVQPAKTLAVLLAEDAVQ